MSALLERFGTSRAVMQASASELAAVGLSAKLIGAITSGETTVRANEIMTQCQSSGIRIVTRDCDAFPQQLRECADAPHVLYVRGEGVDFNRGRWLSVVGTRGATPTGITACDCLVRDAAILYPDTVIVSGLAFGIDKAAHVAALKYGIKTVAVMAGWVDDIVPRSHYYLARQILEAGGAIVSDMPPGTVIDRGNFISRNRIVAGLSPATIVVESAARGGSLITADLADSYNKQLFAMPGRVGDPATDGTNALIYSNKATMYHSMQQVAQALHWAEPGVAAAAHQAPRVDTATLHPRLLTLYNILPDDGHLAVDQIADIADIPIYEASSLLLKLKSLHLVDVDEYRLYYKSQRS